MNQLELSALGAVAVDFESVGTILREIEGDLGDVISSAAVFSALCSLVEQRFVSAYRYDSNTQGYEPVTLPSCQVDDTWFRATKLGLQEYERLVA